MRTESLKPDCSIPQGISRRKFLQLTGVTTAGLMAGYCGTSELDQKTDIALINGTIIDGTGADPIPGGAVVIKAKRIAAVGLQSEVEIPAESDTFDLDGKTILPGFINAHVHSAYDKKTLKTWAQGGVTTVRDLGVIKPISPANLFKARNKLCADPLCARLTAVGPFVNVEGGYPEVRWGGEMVTINSPKNARTAVNKLIDAGADTIKTVMESGYAFRQSGWPLLAPEIIESLVKTAHERKTPVTVHVTSARDLGKALDAGVDEIAHMVVDELSDELVSRMVETGTRWVPTLELWQLVSRMAALEYGKIAIRNLARFVVAGGEVVLGTDYAGAPGATFDLGMPIREIEWMHEAGMTPMQIIVAATKNGAHSCNLLDEVGTLEGGKLADVLVVDGNPLDDLQALTRQNLVLREGKSIPLTKILKYG